MTRTYSTSSVDGNEENETQQQEADEKPCCKRHRGLHSLNSIISEVFLFLQILQQCSAAERGQYCVHCDTESVVPAT